MKEEFQKGSDKDAFLHANAIQNTETRSTI